MKKNRDSNIELLRIVSMLIIVIYHFILHSIAPNNPNLYYITRPLSTVLHIGVICFVLISGYWGIKFSLKGFVKLFLYCSFYSILIYAVGVILNPDLFSVRNVITSLILKQWWFIPVYLSLFLLAPIINIPLKNKNRQTKIVFILILLIISFGFGQYVPSLSDGKNPLNFVLIYYIGNFLRTEVNVNIKKILLVYMLCTIILFVAMLLSDLYIPMVGELLVRFFYPYNSIGLIINSILFFLIFTQLKFNSKYVNWFASSALAVYLVHENDYLSSYLYDFVHQLQSYVESPILFILSVVILAMIVYCIIAIIDKLLSPIFQFMINQIIDSKPFSKVDKKVNNLLDSK
ncbi:MAG: acyltransferase [Flavobacteriales bacterium]|nr:acyltransferase [Flavobacteriales bacterium]